MTSLLASSSGATVHREKEKGREKRRKAGAAGFCWVGPGLAARLTRSAATSFIFFCQNISSFFFSQFSKLNFKTSPKHFKFFFVKILFRKLIRYRILWH